MNKAAVVVASIMAMSSAFAIADQKCDLGAQETASAKHFKNNGDGTITDKRSKLVWRACVAGMSWNGQQCEGTSQTFNYSMAGITLDELNESRDSGRDDWRLPTREELDTLVEKRCYRPAINLNVFSFSPESGFWSSSAGDSDRRVWVVHFLHGGDYIANKNQDWRLRPVASR